MLLLTMKPEVESPLNRICISYNRRGHRAFAVFLLSFFIRLCHRAVSAVGCRSPPSQSGFFTFPKIQIGGNKEWHITTDVRTGNGVSGKKPRKKCCVSMALMKRSLSKSAWRTGQILIPTGGFTDGRATSANTLRKWRTLNSRQSRIALRTYWTRLKTRNCIRHFLRWTSIPCSFSC